MPDILTYNFDIVLRILQAVALLLGIGMFVGGLFQFKRYGEMRTMMSMQMTIATPLMLLLGGTILLVFPTFLGAMLASFWGSESILQYNENASGLGSFMPAIILFVRIIGVGSFIRGVLLLSRTGSSQSQHGTLGKALIHMLAGILCINILQTVNLLEILLGFTPSF